MNPFLLVSFTSCLSPSLLVLLRQLQLLSFTSLRYNSPPSTYDRKNLFFLFCFFQFLFSLCDRFTGIHVPCKTVIFLEVGHRMDVNGFLQMSGRAGRRGFDLEGNVVFGGYGLVLLFSFSASSSSRYPF